MAELSNAGPPFDVPGASDHSNSNHPHRSHPEHPGANRSSAFPNLARLVEGALKEKGFRVVYLPWTIRNENDKHAIKLLALDVKLDLLEEPSRADGDDIAAFFLGLLNAVLKKASDPARLRTLQRAIEGMKRLPMSPALVESARNRIRPEVIDRSFVISAGFADTHTQKWITWLTDNPSFLGSKKRSGGG